MVTTCRLQKCSCILSSVSISVNRNVFLNFVWILVEKNPSLVKLYKDKMGQYMNRAEYIKKTVLDKPAPEQTGGSGGSGAAAQKKKGEGQKDEDDENDKLAGALSGAIVTETPNVKWDDVSGLEAAKEGLKEAVVLPIRFPQLFDEVRQPWRGILLYGPPGTGKTLIARQIAKALNCKEPQVVNGPQIFDKMVGGSEKKIRDLFAPAEAE